MKWLGWPLTIIVIVAALAMSFALFQLGIYFFFLPIIFIPFLGFWKFKQEKIPQCKKCGLKFYGNYCPNCGTKLKK